MLRAAAGVAIVAAGMPLAAAPVELPYPLIEQEKKNWCWSACTQMIEQGKSIASVRSQCRIAGDTLRRAKCCTTADCNVMADVADITIALGRAFLGTQLAGPLDQNTLAHEVRNLRRAVMIGWTWTSSPGGHIVLVYGVAGAGIEPQFLVRDPLPGSGRVRLTYLALATANGKGVWTHSWTGV